MGEWAVSTGDKCSEGNLRWDYFNHKKRRNKIFKKSPNDLRQNKDFLGQVLEVSGVQLGLEMGGNHQDLSSPQGWVAPASGWLSSSQQDELWQIQADPPPLAERAPFLPVSARVLTSWFLTSVWAVSFAGAFQPKNRKGHRASQYMEARGEDSSPCTCEGSPV